MMEVTPTPPKYVSINVCAWSGNRLKLMLFSSSHAAKVKGEMGKNWE